MPGGCIRKHVLLNAHNSSESLGQRCGDPEAAMKAQPLVCLLALMQVACFGNIDALRSLTSIRYRFTPCGVLGENGPGFGTCSQFYSVSESRLVQDDVLVESDDQHYTHAQRFRVPRFGLYNITAAGASGGRGVCNQERGHGNTRTVQVELYHNLEVLVLVGQRGASLCDLEPDIPSCGVTDVSVCNDTWLSYIGEEGVGIGGGGGGGASVVRAYSVSGFNPDPIVIGGGGGGSSALLCYDVVEKLGASVVGVSPVQAYRHYINADGGSSSTESIPGGRNSTHLAGMGGGYRNSDHQLDVDGGSLSDAGEFAVGGLHCDASGLRLNGTFGGFGGGGGGCGGGGGGGGYVGGRAEGQGMLIPGGGGTSYTGAPQRTSFKTIRFISDVLNEEFEDGYVDIVQADCECIFKCTVYHQQDAFECTCPENYLLAGDGIDCYLEANITIEEGPRMSLPPDDYGIVFHYHLFTLESRVFLYSVDFEVEVESTGAEGEEDTIFERCIVAFLGEDYELVAHTNVHRRSTQRLNTLLRFNTSEEEYKSFLDTPVVVIAGIVVSAGDCSVKSTSLNMNISIRGRQFDESVELGSALPSDVADEFLEDITTQLSTPSTSQVSTLLTTALPGEGADTGLAVGLGLSVAAVVVVIAASISACILCISCRKNPKHDYGTAALEEVDLDYVAPKTTKQTSVWKKFSEHPNSSAYRNDYVLLHQS